VDGADDWAEVGVATLGQANDFASYTILLVSEGECGEVAVVEGGIGGIGK